MLTEITSFPYQLVDWNVLHRIEDYSEQENGYHPGRSVSSGYTNCSWLESKPGGTTKSKPICFSTCIPAIPRDQWLYSAARKCSKRFYKTVKNVTKTQRGFQTMLHLWTCFIWRWCIFRGGMLLEAKTEIRCITEPNIDRQSSGLTSTLYRRHPRRTGSPFFGFIAEICLPYMTTENYISLLWRSLFEAQITISLSIYGRTRRPSNRN